MTQDLKTRIEKIYALDRERTQGDWGADIADQVQEDYYIGRTSEAHIFARTYAHFVDNKWISGENNAAFIANAPEMVDIIRSLEAKVEEEKLKIPFDTISIDVSTGEDNFGLRAFADVKDLHEIMHLNPNQRDEERVACFTGYLNNDGVAETIQLQTKLTEADKLLEVMGRTKETMVEYESLEYDANCGWSKEQFIAAQETTKHWREMLEGIINPKPKSYKAGRE